MALNSVYNGFDKHDVVTMEVMLPGTRYPAERRAVFYREALAAIRALPGVESAAAGNSLPVIGSPRGGSWFHRYGTPELPPSQRQTAIIRVVTPGYFRTLRIPVLRGREFTREETRLRAGFLVNDAFVKEYLSGVNPSAVDGVDAAKIVGRCRCVRHSRRIGQRQPAPTFFYSHLKAGKAYAVRAANGPPRRRCAVNAIAN